MTCALQPCYSLARPCAGPRDRRLRQGAPRSIMVPSRDLAARFEAYSDWRRRLSARRARRCTSGCRSRTWPTPRSTCASSSCSSACTRTSWSSPSSPSSRAASPSSSTRSSSPTSASASCRRRRAARRCARPSSSTTPSRPPSIRLLPIETRLKDATVAEFKNYADEWVHLRRSTSRRPRRWARRCRACRRSSACRSSSRASTASTATARTTSWRRSSTATRAASTSRAGGTRSSTSRIRCCSRAS